MNMAKLQCLELGGNLISGLALSVSEATSGNGMLMISCVGTAVRTPHISENFSEYTALKREIEKDRFGEHFLLLLHKSRNK